MLLQKYFPKLNHSQSELLVIISFLLIGSFLRFLWAADMEWKGDEMCMFEQAQQIANGDPRLNLWCTQHSSIPVPHPYVGVWCFAVIAKFASDPISMVRWVQGMNVLTIWLFFGFILWQIAKNHQRAWLWGLAIASVNPMAILFSRKIWIPDLLAPFCFLVFLGYWFRQKFWGGFLWGIAGILSAQVHMSGFFLVFGLLLWTIWHHYRHKNLQEVKWGGWFLGTVVGSLFLIPWLMNILPTLGEHTDSINQSLNLFPRFYLQWLTASLGVNLSNVLWGVFWSDFLREPLIFGIPTYLMVPSHLFLAIIGLYPLYRWWRARQKSRHQAATNQRDSQLNLYLKALAFGVGGAFTLARVNVHSHYIAIVFPFAYIWLAQLYQNRVKLLMAIVLAQLLISVTFLNFIHRTGGTPFGETVYGITYRVQMMNAE
ncbi:MAG: hypothetical protein F6J96_27795 [Symploca sp. SIO1C2]|nr:hypothetical protein [Symploca sp. SIO1C2]